MENDQPIPRKRYLAYQDWRFWIPLVVAALLAIHAIVQIGLVNLQPSGTPTILIYVELLCIPAVFSFSMFLYRGQNEEDNRSVDLSEITHVLAETASLAERLPNHADAKRCLELAKHIEPALAQKRESRRKEAVFELDLLPLRQALVQLYDCPTLLVKLRYELSLLKEYEDDEDVAETCKDWEQRVEELLRRVKDAQDTSMQAAKNSTASVKEPEGLSLSDDIILELRENLRQLRETVAYIEVEWSIGTAIQTFVGYLASSTALCLFIAGVLPAFIVPPPADLNIFHWCALGVSGSMLSTLVSLHDSDAAEIGATQGKLMFKQTLSRLVIGAIAAAMLWGAFNGQIVTSPVFPGPDKPAYNVFRSVFWATMAGFAFGPLLKRLYDVAEQAFGKGKPVQS